MTKMVNLKFMKAVLTIMRSGVIPLKENNVN